MRGGYFFVENLTIWILRGIILWNIYVYNAKSDYCGLRGAYNEEIL